MSFADLTPEQRAENARKSAATRRANAAARRAKRAAPEPAAETPPTLADLGFAAESQDDYRLDDILTNEEIEAIRVKAREKVALEQRKSRAQRLMESATEEARRELGMVPEDEERKRYLEEPTQVRVILPSHRSPSGREIPPDPIILDQRIFVHGRTYTVTRAVAEYIEALMSAQRMYMGQVDGRARTYYNEQIGTMIYQGGPLEGRI